MIGLLENYIVYVTGNLTEARQENLKELEPKLSETWGLKPAPWHKLIQQVMKFPDDIEDKLRADWARYQKTVEAENGRIDVWDFAIILTDHIMAPDAE